MNYTPKIEELENKVTNAHYNYKMALGGYRPAYKIKEILKTSKNLVKAIDNLNLEIIKEL